jgi:hypothetical protein
MHVRIQGWIPYECQIYINGRERPARRLDKAGVGHVRWDDSLLAHWIGSGAGTSNALISEQVARYSPMSRTRSTTPLCPNAC